ncbi:hypothetical protein [Companilactobacillus insicii]|uniref:hypothetical protein n=1 Tax=Companilactobacillus insicii TaxID=1732567 RepID=UPI0013DE48AA|nr:hypothetical protein [Companilactobacillus insicii]
MFDKADFSPKVLTSIDRLKITDRTISFDEPDFKSVRQTAEDQNILNIIHKGNYLQQSLVNQIIIKQNRYLRIILNKIYDIFLNFYHFDIIFSNNYLKKQVSIQGDNYGK